MMRVRSWFDNRTTNGVSAAFTPVRRQGITTNEVSSECIETVRGELVEP
jgi:hypothetical protein